MKRGIAYVLFGNWRTGDSGVDTFVHHIEPLFREGRVRGELVEIPYKEVDCRASESLSVSPHTGDAAGKSRRPGSWRLMAGYVRRILHDVRLLWPLRKKLKGRVLVTNQFGCEPLPLALRMLSPMGRVVAICHTHPPRSNRDHHDRVRRLVERLTYRSVDRIIYNSNSVRDEWRKRMGLERIKGSVIWYGIDPPDKSLPQDYPEKPEGTVDFVCVSRFVLWKGHRELIAAFTAAAQQCSVPMRLILVGDGPTLQECIEHARDRGATVLDRPELQRKSFNNRPDPIVATASPHDLPDAASAKSGPCVFFLGSRPNGAAYFNGADVGVQLSTEPEAFGIVLLEAMSRGKPVLGSRIGGIPEVVLDGQTGILVDPHNTACGARAMVEQAMSSESRQQMGDAGFRRWQEHFTVDRMQRDYVEFFRSETMQNTAS